MIDSPRVYDLTDGLSPREWTLFAASIFGLGAVLVSTVFSLLFFVNPFAPISIVPGATIGAFVSGGVLWWCAVERRRVTTRTTGIGVGVATALVSNAVMSFFLPIDLLEFTGKSSPLADLVRYTALYAVDMAIFTLVIDWYFILPAGGFIGWKLVGLRRSSLDGSPSGSNGQSGAE